VTVDRVHDRARLLLFASQGPST